ncbi:MAG: hypothetical protein A2139_07795 [Desulfobacca sp. RBG_16_60_12]|nr:MAG: hypothetical protein A2139_07795 [Desulfobacca sp. RBG_16_60_12]
MSRILHMCANKYDAEINKRRFDEYNRAGIRTSTNSVVTMANDDEHVWRYLGCELQGTEWDAVVVSEYVRSVGKPIDVAHLGELLPTRVRPK